MYFVLFETVNIFCLSLFRSVLVETRDSQQLNKNYQEPEVYIIENTVDCLSSTVFRSGTARGQQWAFTDFVVNGCGYLEDST